MQISKIQLGQKIHYISLTIDVILKNEAKIRQIVTVPALIKNSGEKAIDYKALQWIVCRYYDFQVVNISIINGDSPISS